MAVWDLPPNKLLSPFNVHLSPSINIPHHTLAFIALLQETKKQCGKKTLQNRTSRKVYLYLYGQNAMYRESKESETLLILK